MMNSSRILALGLATLLVFAAAPHGAAADLAPIEVSDRSRNTPLAGSQLPDTTASLFSLRACCK